MANTIGSAFRSWWHTMTSNDRHATIDSPYRTGRHVPLSRQSGVLTSVATGSESRREITSHYLDDGMRSSSALDTAYGGAGASSPMPGSPALGGRPYSPGLRSASAQQSNHDGFEMQSPGGEIPMQSFQDGMPPPPPVSHSWSRIDEWAEEHYPELFDQLCEGCTVNDLNETEIQLDCSLPQDVRDSLQHHDGQERGGMPTGIIFGSMLLDCEEMVQEWENWRKVTQEILLAESTAPKLSGPSVPTKALGGSSSGQASSSRAEAPSSSRPTSPAAAQNNTQWRQDLMSRQDCVPPLSIQKTYAHPAWIPLVRDWGGNNLAVDLAPGPKGQWGQIILFGRDYDTKYVVARSWAAFLALVADDLNSGKWFVDEETNELKLREFKAARVEPAYFDILRWRMDQKYGRRALSNKRKSVVPGAASPSGSGSPYASPVDGNSEPRGRSMQRLSGVVSPLSSPIRPGYGKSSPLARVNEEPIIPLAPPEMMDSLKAKEKLVEVDTPRPSGEADVNPNALKLVNGDAHAANTNKSGATTENADSSTKAKGKENEPVILEEAMKTIEI